MYVTCVCIRSFILTTLENRSMASNTHVAHRTSSTNRKCIKTILKSSIQHPSAVCSTWTYRRIYVYVYIFNSTPWAVEAMCAIACSPGETETGVRAFEGGVASTKCVNNVIEFCVIFITSTHIQWPKKSERQNDVESHIVRRSCPSLRVSQIVRVNDVSHEQK